MHRIIELNNQDAPTVAAYVPTEYADKLIALAGGRQDALGRWYFEARPKVRGMIWERDEALLVALGKIADRTQVTA